MFVPLVRSVLALTLMHSQSITDIHAFVFCFILLVSPFKCLHKLLGPSFLLNDILRSCTTLSDWSWY